MEQKYKMIDPHDFERAEEHHNTLVTDDPQTTDAIHQWYEDNGFLLPVFFVVRQIDGKDQRAVIDGWKKVLYACKKDIKAIPAVEIRADKKELTSIMVQLQSSGHNGLMALYHMIEALYPKYFLGQGHRSDLSEVELNKAVEGEDGRKLNLYERIGRNFGINSGNKIKYILKVGKINPLHFERIENSRFTLYQAFQECTKEEAGYEPEVPKAKPPGAHGSMTSIPDFNDSDSTVHSDFENSSTSTSEIDSSIERIVTVRGVGKCCGRETDMEIDINKYL